jgi:SAM-dependent methyltransferase
MQPLKIHLSIIQPLGYVHSLGFLDQARFFRYQFRRLGAEVSLGKNRLHQGAINFVFGAHLGFDTSFARRYHCVIVNLEQLGEGGSKISAEYLSLLSQSQVVDYDPANVPAYRSGGDPVPIISFAYAPYLAGGRDETLEARPIDLLFFGSMNERRQRLLKEIEAAGCRLSILNFGLYGPERDAEIRRAKAVFNCHFYDSARFEQARAFQCLSLGTPVISERSAYTQPPAAFEESVFWVPSEGIRKFFAGEFKSAAFFDAARAKLAHFAGHDVHEQYAAVLARAREQRHAQTARELGPWRPDRLHIGSGKDYKPGWLNIDIAASTQPDMVLDLSEPIGESISQFSDTVGRVELTPESLQFIYANNVLEHVPDLPQLMTNCLRLLREGGQMLIEVPYEHAPTAWQDPTHVRALNENSWIYYTDWFWYLGWFETRFALQRMTYLDANLAECKRESAHFIRVLLQKVQTTAAEKVTARTMRADFGGVPGDAEEARPT